MVLTSINSFMISTHMTVTRAGHTMLYIMVAWRYDSTCHNHNIIHKSQNINCERNAVFHNLLFRMSRCWLKVWRVAEWSLAI